MASDVNGSQRPQFLNSWKEIANYMGKGVRTVQRYEAQFGLPVRRPAGKSRSSVMATRAEIDAWVAASPIRETYQLTKTSDTSRTADLAAVKEGVKEMRNLREHMLELRRETHVALSLFMRSLNNLHSMLNSALPAPAGDDGLRAVDPGGRNRWTEDIPTSGFHPSARRH